MYEVIKAAITGGAYRLEAMTGRIRMFAAKGLISMEEMESLEELARENATVRGDTDLFEKVQELERRIRALESGSASPTDDYPAYQAGKWYLAGDRCSENGANYLCIAPEGVVCTWPPSGYPAYWEAQ